MAPEIFSSMELHKQCEATFILLHLAKWSQERRVTLT